MQDNYSMADPLWDIELADGCQLTVLQSVGTQQCALALSLSAGSHDEPVKYLGMAHFLEHLVFRGSKSYELDDGLMAFVQRNGGHVNAKTEARQTLFHFQVGAPLFIGAIERLVDMLVSPRLEDAMLVSEREVINEEFGLYCQSPQMLMDAALAVCLLGAHPLQRFYAGNRESLCIEDEHFKIALAAFHQASYMSSQLKIAIVVPDDWRCWKTQVLSALRPLTRVVRHRYRVPVDRIKCLKGSMLKLCLPVPEQYFVLHVPINCNGAGLVALAEKMQHALVIGVGQTFLAYVKKQNWCSSITVRAPYAVSEQGVLTIEFKRLTGECAALLPTFCHWLRQWREQLHSADQKAYERQAQANRWLVAQPLTKAQHMLSGCWPLQGVSLACLAALDAVVERIECQAFVQIIAGPESADGFYNAGLPLQVERIEKNSSNLESVAYMPQSVFASGLESTAEQARVPQKIERYALCQHPAASFPKDLAVCYWGWLVAHPQDVAQRLQDRIAPLLELLSYNAVHGQVECTRNYVFIRITGPAEYLPVALNQLLATLELPLVDLPTEITGHFALRRLLQRLPAALAGASSTTYSDISLAEQKQSALWLGSALMADVLDERYLQRLQKLVDTVSVQPYSAGWQYVTDSRSDDALLVIHMPLPAISIAEKDRMRVVNKVFSQYFQSALQRYLRDERGLCYAVFVMPSALANNEGLVCAVQSGKVSAAQIRVEIRHCLNAIEERLPELLPRLHAEVLVQAEQLEQGDLGLDGLSQMMFRHWREQRLETGCGEEAHAARLVTYTDIEKYYSAIQSHSNWFLLSNQPSTI